MNHLNFPRLIAPLKFYAVVPTAQWVERMVQAGANTVQLRNKQLTGNALKHEIQRSIAACTHSNTQLFINDYWQDAMELGAYGVHLGQEDLDTADLNAIAQAGLRLGVSTHSVAELARALSVRPSYVASGAIFPTTTKQMPTAPQGLDNLAQYVAQVRAQFSADEMPIVAIGGIDLHNARAVLATGVSALAVVRAVTEAQQPENVVRAFQQILG